MYRSLREAPELEIRLFPFLCQGFDSISSSEKMEAETAIHLEDGWLSIGMEITKPLHQKSLEIHPFPSIHLEDAWGIQEESFTPQVVIFCIATIWFGKKTIPLPQVSIGRVLNFPQTTHHPFWLWWLKPWWTHIPGSSNFVWQKNTGELSSTAGAADGVAEAERSTSIAGFGGSIPILFSLW